MLLVDVYLAAYGGSRDSVKFIIRPTPRIENREELLLVDSDRGHSNFSTKLKNSQKSEKTGTAPSGLGNQQKMATRQGKPLVPAAGNVRRSTRGSGNGSRLQSLQGLLTNLTLHHLFCEIAVFLNGYVKCNCGKFSAHKLNLLAVLCRQP